MAAANETRGEVSLTLEGESYVLRPTWQAIKAFETETGKGVMQLAQEARAMMLTSTEAATIATECIRAWGRANETGLGKIAREVNQDRIGELIMDSDGGFAAATGRLGLLLMIASTGGYTSQGELKPATERKKRAATPAAG